MTFRDQLGHVPPDGQCLKFANKDPASIAVDFTADEQEKGGIKMTILTLNAVGTAARDHNTITVTLDMKSAIKKGRIGTSSAHYGVLQGITPSPSRATESCALEKRGAHEV